MSRTPGSKFADDQFYSGRDAKYEEAPYIAKSYDEVTGPMIREVESILEDNTVHSAERLRIALALLKQEKP